MSCYRQGEIIRGHLIDWPGLAPKDRCLDRVFAAILAGDIDLAMRIRPFDNVETTPDDDSSDDESCSISGSDSDYSSSSYSSDSDSESESDSEGSEASSSSDDDDDDVYIPQPPEHKQERPASAHPIQRRFSSSSSSSSSMMSPCSAPTGRRLADEDVCERQQIRLDQLSRSTPMTPTPPCKPMPSSFTMSPKSRLIAARFKLSK